ncbi:MAG: hypothetical protein DRQ13_04845, partial [Ignavibacteriae bacterium]
MVLASQGQSGGDPTGIPYIQNTTIEGSESGISAINLTDLIIKYNIITDSDLGIFLSSVTSPYIAYNNISSANEEMPGILMSSSGGEIIGNSIKGHTNGIELGNSSPDIGDNEIDSNLVHGIYIGTGSRPYMIGKFAGTEPNEYPMSGYNDIFDNGGYNATQDADDDGSEIFFSTSNADMKVGCNSIYDNR